MLIRDPFDGLVSEWNRKNSASHTGYANLSTFTDNNKWDYFVRSGPKHWWHFYTFYHNNYRSDQLHIVRYEKLKENLGLEMKKVMDFLNLKIENDVESCAIQKQTGSFKRPKSNIDFKQFITKSQLEDIEEIKINVYAELGLISYPIGYYKALHMIHNNDFIGA